MQKGHEATRITDRRVAFCAICLRVSEVTYLMVLVVTLTLLMVRQTAPLAVYYVIYEQVRENWCDDGCCSRCRHLLPADDGVSAKLAHNHMLPSIGAYSTIQ